MTWSYEYNPSLKVLEVAYRGSTTARDLQDSTSEFIRLEHEQGINRFLVDTSEIELNATLLDVHELPNKQYVAEKADKSARLAVVLSTSRFEREAALFYRDACQNRGYKVEAFDDRQQAITWLVGDASS